MRRPRERLPDDPRELIPDPPLDLLVVALAGMPTGLLAGPAEALGEEAEDVVGVVDATEVTGDQRRHAGGRPQLVRPAVRLRPLGQQQFEPAEVGVGQSGGGAGRRRGGQPVGSAGGADPAGDGVRVDAEDGGHGLPRLPLGNGANGLPAAAFQFGGGSDWSAHDRFESRRVKTDSFPMRDAVVSGSGVE